MRKITVLFLILTSFFATRSYGYQDTIVKNEVVQEGNQICQERYDLIRPILDRYHRRFSVLDIGANLGYFSLRIAEDYDAICTMIEGSDSSKRVYSDAQHRLLSICNLNSHLDNIYFLNHQLNLNSTRRLNDLEHFDVVLAFLVVHMLAADNKGIIKMDHIHAYIDLLLSLGDNVIFEMSVDVYPRLDELMQQVCKQRGGIFLGEMPRAKNLNHKKLGRFYWFQNKKKLSDKAAEPISPKTFVEFNGVFPTR